MIRYLAICLLAFVAASSSYTDESKRTYVRILEKAALGTHPVAMVAHKNSSSIPREDIPENAVTLLVLNQFASTKRWDALYRELLD